MDSGIIAAVMGAIDGGESISGADVIDALCQEIAASLAQSCHLRQSDAYRAFSARVAVTLQLLDLDPVETGVELTVGTPDPSKPSQTIILDLPTISAEKIRERSGVEPPSLERRVDGGEIETAATPAAKRGYVSRVRASK